MKKLIIINAILFFCGPLCAQSSGEGPIRERIHVSTDKDNYLSGEIAWMKLITTDTEGKPLDFSKTGYVELLDEEHSRVRARIEIWNGVGEGTLVLPSTLPTGWYRLVGYTRWMRNEGPEIFFEKRIGIVNPSLSEVTRGGATDDPALPVPAAAMTGGAMKVSTDRSSYSPRGEVRLDISGIPADIHTLGVSVTAADPLGGFTGASLGAWKAAIPTGVPPASSEKYEAEYEGAVITGKLVPAGSATTAPVASLHPMVSFPGYGINLFDGGVDETGRVVFRTPRVTGFNEIVTTMRGDGANSWIVELDDPFEQASRPRPLPTYPLGAIDREALLRQSVAMQVQYSYAQDSLTRGSRTEPQFLDRPDHSYRMEEWKRFATMYEVVREFVRSVQFSRVEQEGRRWYLSVINSDFDFSQTNTLVLLDGIPIFDHEIIYNYNPLLLDRIDVYSSRYLFGDDLFFGIVALYTSGYYFPELQPDPFTRILSYDSPQARRLFYAPDYSGDGRRESRVADFRHTLYWNADLRAEDGHSGVSFHASDLTGSYQVLVEGLTASGEAVSAVCSLEVR